MGADIVYGFRSVPNKKGRLLGHMSVFSWISLISEGRFYYYEVDRKISGDFFKENFQI